MSGTVRLLIAALGGEGGGVLSEWIVAAAHAQGLAVQATSVPGVAQRTGATTYYVEMAPAPKKGPAPVFALMPVEGGLDLVVATELLEAGRMVERGFVTPGRTFVLASTHRMLTVPEKSARGDGAYSAAALMQAVESRSRDRFLFDMAQTSRQAGAFINSVVIGAIAGLGLLPIAEHHFRAVVTGGKDDSANARGYRAGLDIVSGATAALQAAQPKRPARADEPADLAMRVAAFPEEAREVVRIGAARLADYQGPRYAALYLDRLAAFREAGPLLREVARHLAVRMSYEDIVRVAQLKVRPDRFARIRAEIGIDADEPHEVVEFFKPGIPELADMMPPFIGRRLLAWAAKNPARRNLNFGMRVRTTTINGFLRVWLLARLRAWRPRSHRYREEQRAIEDWLALVGEALSRDAQLARQVCDLARIVKGYGDTHRRAREAYDGLVARHVRPALAGDIEAGRAAQELEQAIGRVLATH